MRSAPLSGARMQVPAVGAAAVRGTLEKAFGKPVEELFDDFEFEPIAAASLGQVHLATLNGRRVVVKVQRPGLRDLFRVDLKNVRVIAQWLQVCPSSPPVHRPVCSAVLRVPSEPAVSGVVCGRLMVGQAPGPHGGSL